MEEVRAGVGMMSVMRRWGSEDRPVLAVVGSERGEGRAEWSVGVGEVREVVSGCRSLGKANDGVTGALGLWVRLACVLVRGSQGTLGRKKYPR